MQCDSHAIWLIPRTVKLCIVCRLYSYLLLKLLSGFGLRSCFPFLKLDDAVKLKSHMLFVLFENGSLYQISLKPNFFLNKN